MKSVSELFGSKSSYGSLLRTEEWSAFARVMRKERGNACECCRLGNKELHVHHLYYEAGKKPWEADTKDVIVLCKSCHEQIHEQLQKFRKYVFRYLRPDAFRVLNGALSVGLTQHNGLEFAYAVAEMAASPRSIERFCAAWINKPVENRITARTTASTGT